MEREKPDASVQVNGFGIAIFRRGQGLRIEIEKEGQEVGFFGIAGAPMNLQELPVAPASIPEPETPAYDAPPSPEVKKPEQPVKIEGTVEEIEGLGQTPTAGDPVFRFRVKRMNPSIGQEEVVQIAAFRQIGQTLHELANSPDPNIKLMPGRPISMMAWDHTSTTGSYYPSLVNYLNLPAITNPKTQKRR